MRRYFYKANPFVKRALEKQINSVQHEDNVFRAAMLARIRNKPKEQQRTHYEQVIDRTIQQQSAIAQADHLQQLFTHFDALHKAARCTDVLYEYTRFQREGLVDPDKFPISQVQQVRKKWLSGWPHLLSTLRKQLGFSLKVKPSSLQHIDSGRGVYIDGTVPAGTFLGFVPGSYYNSFKLFQKHREERLKLKQYLHFPTNSILDFTKIDYPPCEHELDGSYRNPYALGEIVNHPAPRTSANICFQQLLIPKGFFPSYYLKYLPVMQNTDRNKDPAMEVVGMFSLRDISHSQELFVNYLQHHVYPIEQVPEWLIEPPPASVYLVKNEYENLEWDMWRVMENYALRHNRAHYQRYRQTVRYEPDRYEYERNGRNYRKLNLVKFQEPR